MKDESCYAPRNVEHQETTKIGKLEQLEDELIKTQTKLDKELQTIKERLKRKSEDHTQATVSRRYFLNKSEVIHDQTTDVVTVNEFNQLKEEYDRLNRQDSTAKTV